jgi:hypothetical protein
VSQVLWSRYRLGVRVVLGLLLGGVVLMIGFSFPGAAHHFINALVAVSGFLAPSSKIAEWVLEQLKTKPLATPAEEIAEVQTVLDKQADAREVAQKP